MGVPHDTDEAVVIQRLEKLGPAQVRMLMQNGGWAYAYNPATLKWLAEKDQEAERLKAAAVSEQTSLTLAANETASRAASAVERQARAAESANTRATIALIIAVISAAITIISILLVHYDAMNHTPK